MGAARVLAATLGVWAVVGCVAACSPAVKAAASRPDLAQHYLAIANPANRILDRSFDTLEGHDDDVRAAALLLQTIATTERRFDRDLLAITLPAPMSAVAAELARVNELRAALTSEAATATSVAELRRREVDLDAMNVPVETQVAVLRRDLGLPPPSSG